MILNSRHGSSKVNSLKENFFFDAIFLTHDTKVKNEETNLVKNSYNASAAFFNKSARLSLIAFSPPLSPPVTAFLKSESSFELACEGLSVSSRQVQAFGLRIN